MKGEMEAMRLGQEKWHQHGWDWERSTQQPPWALAVILPKVWSEIGFEKNAKSCGKPKKYTKTPQCCG